MTPTRSRVSSAAARRSAARLPDSVDGLIEREPVRRRFDPLQPRRATQIHDVRDAAAGRTGSRISSTWSPAAGLRASSRPSRLPRRSPTRRSSRSPCLAPAADAIGVAVGDRLPAAVDPGDPLLRNTFPRPATAVAFEVVGTFSVRDPAARYWFDDRSLAEVGHRRHGGQPHRVRDGRLRAGGVRRPAPARPAEPLSLERCSSTSTGLMPAGWTSWSRTCAGSTPRSSRPARPVPGGCSFAPGSSASSSGISGNATTTEAALSVAALGPLAVAAGAVGLIGILVVRRRRPALALARGRGASSGQLLAAQLWEGAARSPCLRPLIGLALAALVVIPLARAPCRRSGRSSWPSVRPPSCSPRPCRSARRARRDLERDDPPVFRRPAAPARVRGGGRRSRAGRRLAAARARADGPSRGRAGAVGSTRSSPRPRCSSGSPSACSRSASTRCRSAVWAG